MSGFIGRVDDDDFARRILGRDLIALPKSELCRAVVGKIVLLTGAGGFIGSSLARLLAGLGAKQIVLVENSERALYEVERELRELAPACAIHPVLCDIRDRIALDHLFTAQRPQVVLHAAALKQLPMVEANLREASLTNVVGTANLVACSQSAGVEALIHISSDKAAAPISMLGRSKRVAELVCQAGDSIGGMRCASVRFNNVFGSTGSVVPLFCDQIARGKPLSITHTAMTRYFITASEAAQLVVSLLGAPLLDATVSRPIYVLQTGTSLPIVELARRIMADAGRDVAAELLVTGIRPGEKLDESLIAPWEKCRPTASELIGLVCDDRLSNGMVRQLVEDLREACERFDEAELGKLLDLATADPSSRPALTPDLAAM